MTSNISKSDLDLFGRMHLTSVIITEPHLRIDTHFADIHGFMSVALVGAIVVHG